MKKSSSAFIFLALMLSGCGGGGYASRSNSGGYGGQGGINYGNAPPAKVIACKSEYRRAYAETLRMFSRPAPRLEDCNKPVSGTGVNAYLDVMGGYLCDSRNAGASGKAVMDEYYARKEAEKAANEIFALCLRK